MKISGLFSEMSAPDAAAPLYAIAQKFEPWFTSVLVAFGPRRCMFGSDWPVCNVNGLGVDVAWGRWYAVVQKWVDTHVLDPAEREWIWWRSANEAYGLRVRSIA